MSGVARVGARRARARGRRRRGVARSRSRSSRPRRSSSRSSRSPSAARRGDVDRGRRARRTRGRCWPRSSSSSSPARARRGRCGRAWPRSPAAGAAVALALALAWLVPRSGWTRATPSAPCSRSSRSGSQRLRLRRATLFQVLGIVLVENGLALAALELPGTSSLAIEIGVALDLTARRARRRRLPRADLRRVRRRRHAPR